jgi:hypothetical protein
MNQQAHIAKNILNRMVVQEALKRSQDLDIRSGLNQKKPVNGQDTVISLLIHDIFGGEILKTHNKKGWHFYNRIDGERVDFSTPQKSKSIDADNFEDLPATPDEPCKYFEQEDYSTFFMRFINAFEETVGLEKYQTAYTD